MMVEAQILLYGGSYCYCLILHILNDLLKILLNTYGLASLKATHKKINHLDTLSKNSSWCPFLQFK